MKKIICLMLCVILTCFSLVACSQDTESEARDELDDFLNDPDYNPVVVEEMTFDFYIVTGDETSDNAILTVESRINAFLKPYKTTLDIHYLTMGEYEQTVLNDVKKLGDDKADIFLITSESMFNTLYSENNLADLTSLLKSDEYKTLSQMCGALLDASEVSVTEGSGLNEYTVDHNYCIPNNHVVSKYDFVLVHRATAEKFNMGSTDMIAQMNSEGAEMTVEFKNRLRRYGPADGISSADALKFVSGTYADIEKYTSEGYHVVIESMPVVTKAEAYSSAFAISKHALEIAYENAPDQTKFDADKIKTFRTYYDRCMQVIYLLNTNSELRNLLQYGELNINYSIVDGNVVRSTVENNIYDMSLLYTGDLFKALYCEELGWTEFVKDYGTKQNAQAVKD